MTAAYAAIKRAADAGESVSQADVTDRNSPWTPVFDHFTSLGTSADPDQVAVQDSVNYNDTDENWPLREGFGNLIARFGADIDVNLNCPVDSIDWTRKEIRVKTRKGTIECRSVLITVSTGILSAGDIRFDPVLPEWKQSAIMALPLGTHNRVGILFDRDIFGKNCPLGAAFMFPDSEVQGFSLNAFGEHYACGYTGGRHAVWIERAGQQAAIDLTLGHLVRVFGSDIRKHVTRTIVTAWHGDPWTKGSYSAAMPGQGHQRIELARPIDDRLYFAGEATSVEFMATAHGAYLTGIASVDAIARKLGVASI
jgi:monoamine oxidase